MEPQIVKRKNTIISKTCHKCKQTRSADDFLDVKPWHFEHGKFHVCNSCIKEHFKKLQWDWTEVDHFLQEINVPFVPSEFERLHEINADDVLPIYVRMFSELRYSQLDWAPYYLKYSELHRKGKLDMELPNIRDSYYDDLRLRWGPEYDEEALTYLESLYNGMLISQNINGALQSDQAQKLCKISWNIDERIRADVDFDKLMASYDKMAKIADFTPKNVRSDSDFSAMGEVVAWLEKRGWLNPHLTNAKKDPIDNLISNTQTFAQRLYVNETGLGEEVEERIQQLKLAAELEERDMALGLNTVTGDEEEVFFKLDEGTDLESYENEGYEKLMIDEVLDSDMTSI